MPRIRFVATTIASLVLSFVPFVFPGAQAATISVNSIADMAANDGQCTLREAMIAANTNTASGAAAGECAAGQATPTIDVIAFNIPGAGVHTIVPTTALPGITEIVTIDGYTQPGSHTNSLATGNDATLLVEIDVHNVPNDPVLALHSGASTIRGLVLSHFTSVGIQVGDGFGNGANGVRITGNFIGTNPAGTALSGGGTAISVDASTATMIGGATPALRNVIAGTAGGGGSMIFLNASDGNSIQGNYIGVNAAGTAALGGANGAIGLVLSSFNLIGGAAAGAGNVIAGYTVYGISLEGNSNRVQGNFIGTNATGTAGLGAGGYGIIAGASTGAQIGGNAAGAGNLISGNGKSGIKVVVGPLSLLIQGNKIGTDLAGTGALGNGQCGIEMSGEGGAGGNGTIGGTTPSAGNTIAFNGTHGVGIFASFSFAILGNSMANNGGLGIALNGRCDTAAATPTPNDAGDGDTGPDLLQNYPVLTSANLTPGNVAVSGTLNSTPLTTFRVEFFANPLCDASGHGEGKVFLGFANVPTDASGNATFGPLSFAVPAHHFFFTATATGLAGGVTPHNTSEFSACVGSARILDIDDNGAYDALTDGLLVLRGFFGLTGSSLINGAIGVNANRNTAPVITAYIDSMRTVLDIDGNGQADALTDGLMTIRYLFGLRGASVVNNAIGAGAQRTTSSAIGGYILMLMP